MPEKIILLHGIFRTERSMERFARFLRGHGYEVLNLGYPSTRMPIAELAEHLHPEIVRFVAGGTPVHVIGYSMGGLVARAYLATHRPATLGKVLFLATPNRGSELADRLKDWSPYRHLYGPAGQELVTGPSDRFGIPDYPFGVIAGNRSLDPIGWSLLPKPNDGKVSVAATKLDGMAMHRVVPVNHTWFPMSRTVWRAALEFLKN